MILLLNALVLVQSGGWTVSPRSVTVGDTVVLERAIPLSDPSIRVRAPMLEASRLIEPLRDPEVVYEAAGARVRHVVAAFQPGSSVVSIPPIELVFPDGRVEVVPGGEVVIPVVSVLPDSTAPPRESRAPLEVFTLRRLPALLFPAIILIVAIVWGVLRRRVGRRPTWEPDLPASSEPVSDGWVSAGEPRAVAALTMTRLRRRLADWVPEATESLSVPECLDVIARERPDWPHRELSEIMKSLERASFAPAVPSDVLMVVDHLEEVLQTIESHPEPVS
jgi:hypothetical protein